MLYSYTAAFLNTRLLGRFTHISYLNCDHVCFVYILKQRRKQFCGFKKNSRIFKNLNFFFTKLKTFKTHFLKFLSFIKFPCGPLMSHKNLGPIGSAVLAFIGYKQTDKQTDRQAKFIYRYAFSPGVASTRPSEFGSENWDGLVLLCIAFSGVFRGGYWG